MLPTRRCSVRKLMLGVLPILFSGCVAAPMMRTYLAPNPEDGALAHPGGCSWPRTGKNGLSRTVAGIKVEVFPSYSKRDPLHVRVVLGNSLQSVHVDANLTGLLVDGTEEKVRPTAVTVSDGHPYWLKVIVYEFAALPAGATRISLTFDSGFLVVDDMPIAVEPFRFDMARKLDLYYQSINC